MNKETLLSYTDEELLVLFTSDHSLASHVFGEIYDRHRNRVYAYALRITANKDDARDILQETFIKLYQALQSTTIANIGAYTLVTARNLCLNNKRTRKHFEPLTEQSAIQEFSQHYENKDLVTQLSKALQFLDIDQREAFVLRYYHNLEYDTIAEITGQTINTVRNRVWRAKEKVKHLLAPIINDFFL
ncbi:MAG TPA: RNA polymerase sigma factor [Candidatus Kapabacteria bacterium]|jgi:RNA polymerase sigma-70 factor (ECF subfamily)|nr:RNA polymerase sigma factor [Ignavibacteria bacterium]HRE58669.1 RNA polymerase sigma factor [Candidatus Kapabacteria bacterium]HRK58064.1 RNA polymerase sigma factor [Candidatus Kapabacteria bacterium]